jgi:16S rRNA (uracil1498-N3)-methyltransferase
VARRIHVSELRTGEIPLDRAAAHHARDVLRLEAGTAVEVFDDAGRAAEGTLVFTGPGDVAVRVDRVDEAADHAPVRLTVAAAVPKADRADWMVEKLSELGVAEFIPLAAARSVVLPEGKNKLERWARIATEAAKQSRRAGVMRIAELTPVAELVRRWKATAENAAASGAWYLSTESDAALPVARAAASLPKGAALTAFIGPEGGWTPDEQKRFEEAGVAAVRLTHTILRIETAAVTTAAVVACDFQSRTARRA